MVEFAPETSPPFPQSLDALTQDMESRWNPADKVYVLTHLRDAIAAIVMAYQSDTSEKVRYHQAMANRYLISAFAVCGQYYSNPPEIYAKLCQFFALRPELHPLSREQFEAVPGATESGGSPMNVHMKMLKGKIESTTLPSEQSFPRLREFVADIQAAFRKLLS